MNPAFSKAGFSLVVRQAWRALYGCKEEFLRSCDVLASRIKSTKACGSFSKAGDKG
jgi:hypothetical protein